MPSAADLRAAARAELSIPGRYHLHDAVVTPQKTWLQLALQWVYDRWMDFAKALFAHIHVGRGAESAFGDLLIVFFLLVVAFAGARLMRSLQIARDRSPAVISTLGAQRTSHTLWLRASEAAQAADYASAIRMLFAATVTLLDLRGIVRDDASATVNELRTELLRRSSPAGAPFVELARGFTLAAYAERPVERDDWESAQRAYHALAESVSTT